MYESDQQPIINHFNKTQELEDTLIAEVIDCGSGIRVVDLK